MRKFRLGLVLLLLIPLLNMGHIQLVKADGAIQSMPWEADFTIEIGNDASGGWSDNSSTSLDAGNYIARYIQIGDYYITDSYSMWVRLDDVDPSDPYDGDLYALVYEAVSSSDAGAFVEDLGDRDGYDGWWEFKYGNEDLSGNSSYFLGLTGQARGGTEDCRIDMIASGNHPMIIDSAYSGDPYFQTYEDPITGETGYYYDIAVYLDAPAWKNGETVNNTFTGNEFGKVFHRAVNYTFPIDNATIDISGRSYTLWIPANETFSQIYYYSGGYLTLPSSAYTVIRDYNATYHKITIPEATIDSYGDAYKIESGWQYYAYDFYGVYYENGTMYEENATVYAYRDGYDVEEFNITFGVGEYNSNISVDLFTWEVGSDIRKIVPNNLAETYYLTTSDQTMAFYGFEVRDYSNVIAGGAYLESYKTINGTERLIERVDIGTGYNEVQLLLVYQTSYHLAVVTSEQTVYDQGYFIAGVDTSPMIVLNEISFENSIHIAHEHILIAHFREELTNITINYQDQLEMTDSLNWTVWDRWGVMHYNVSNVGGQIVSFTWSGADNETVYVSKLYITHSYYDNPMFTEILFVPQEDKTDLIDFSFLGTSIIPLNQIFMIGLVWIMGGIFSFVSVGIGSIFIAGMTTLLTFWGLLDVDWKIIAFMWGMALTIIFSRGRMK